MNVVEREDAQEHGGLPAFDRAVAGDPPQDGERREEPEQLPRRQLRLEDIDWVQDRILFRVSKQGKASQLPLTSEVGESLLDYLRYARPFWLTATPSNCCCATGLSR